MSRGRDHWLDLARSSTPDDLREHILTGHQSGKPFTPYEPTIALPPDLGRVLDFGCGVGRTFPYLRRVARHVTGFDLPPMIERCRALAPVPADRLEDDWNALRGERFEAVEVDHDSETHQLRVLGRHPFGGPPDAGGSPLRGAAAMPGFVTEHGRNGTTNGSWNTAPAK